MGEAALSLITCSWIFLVIYIGGMIVFGIVASRKVRSADDFATARGGYGPFFLALAFAGISTLESRFAAGWGRSPSARRPLQRR